MELENMKNLNLETIASFLGYSSLYLKVILSFLISFLITFTAIPKIIRVSYRKQLMDVPGLRSSHTQKIPRLGGVAIYFAITIVSCIFSPDMLFKINFFPAALVLLFFIGLMDDLLVVAPKKKLYAQLIASLMIVVGSDIRIESFFGLLGIYELPYLFSVLFTVFVIILIINAYNLIDGIDGLAGSVGALIAISFVFIFFRLYDYQMGMLAISILASLLAFLYFNLSEKYKIFMGDTGSMVVGFLIAFMSIKFMSLSALPWVMIKSAPVVSIAILIVPLIDTLSVIIIRLMKGKSPLKADRNHIHHRVLRLGFNHLQTAMLICAANVLLILLSYTIRHLNINLMLFILVMAALFLSYLPLVLVEFMNKKRLKIENDK